MESWKKTGRAAIARTDGSPSCPRCGFPASPAGRYCGQCGLALPAIGENLLPGRVSDPKALPAPAGFARCGESADLFFRWASAWGDQPMLGTEPLGIEIFNRGYDLAAIQLQLRVFDQSDACMLELDRSIDLLRRGMTTTVEVHSYELARPVGRVEASLISAEFEGFRG